MTTLYKFCMLLCVAIMLQSAGCNNVKEVEYKGIQDAKLQKLGLKSSTILINLKYYNPNKFWINVKETDLSIYLNDKFVAVADQPEKTKIPKMSDFVFPIVAHFDPLKVAGSALKSLFSKTNKVSIQGTAKVGKDGIYIKIPISITENVNLLSN